MKLNMWMTDARGIRKVDVDTADFSNLSTDQKFQFYWPQLVLSGLVGLITVLASGTVWFRWAWPVWLLGFAVVLWLPLIPYRPMWELVRKQVETSSPFSTLAPFAIVGAATMSGMPVWFAPLLALLIPVMASREKGLSALLRVRGKKGVYWFTVLPGWFSVTFLYCMVASVLFYSRAEMADMQTSLPTFQAFMLFLIEAALTVVVIYLSTAHVVIGDAALHNRRVVETDVVAQLRASGVAEIDLADTTEKYVVDHKEAVDAMGLKALGGDAGAWVEGFHAAIGYHDRKGLLAVFIGFSAQAIGFIAAPFAFAWRFFPMVAEWKVRGKSKATATATQQQAATYTGRVVRGTGATTSEEK